MSEEEAIHKICRKYFTESKIQQDIAKKIVQLAEEQGNKHKEAAFLKNFFETFTRCFDSKNAKFFLTSGKRFLYIIHQLLEKSQSSRYCEAISKQIVQYYLYFFSNIFKYSLHELSKDLKLYRMKWVRRISDKAFHKLRQQILEKHKFNLNKGFSEENLDKIKKIHKKKGLSEQQSNFYLGLEQKTQVPYQDKKEQVHSSSQSDSEQDQKQVQTRHRPSKRIKIDHGNHANQVINNQYSYTFEHNKQPPKNLHYSEPPHQYGYYNMSVHNNFQRPIQVRNSYEQMHPYVENYPAVGHSQAQPPIYHYQQPKQGSVDRFDSTFQTNSSSFSAKQKVHLQSLQPIYSDINNHTQSIGPQSNEYSIRPFKETDQLDKGRHSLNLIMKLNECLLYCKQCGKNFNTKQMYDKHANQHFFQNFQKNVQSEVKTKKKVEPIFKLLDFKNWETTESHLEKQYNFEVPLSEISLQNEKAICYFCNKQLESIWSESTNSWVFKNCVKINDSEGVNIMHYDCFESFKSDENSPTETEN